jgi:hypothetical protein
VHRRKEKKLPLIEKERNGRHLTQEMRGKLIRQKRKKASTTSDDSDDRQVVDKKGKGKEKSKSGSGKSYHNV